MAATIFGSFFLASISPRAPLLAYLLYWPGLLVFWAFGNSSPWILFLAIVFHVLAVAEFWYFAIHGWRKASRDCLRALGGCAVVAVCGWLWLDWYQHAEDWTSLGLNPDRPGFSPSVVVLAGEVSSPRGTFNFEMRMRGEEFHYCRRWTGKDWSDVGPSWLLELEMADFSGRYGQTRYAYSTKGGGGSSGRTDSLVPGRRLWKGNQFVGAKEKETTATLWRRYGGSAPMLSVGTEPDSSVITGSRQLEMFSKLERHGPFLIPKRIVMEDPNRGNEVFEIKRVEFDIKPDEEWFHQVKRKYFDHDQKLRMTDVDEPGLFVWGRAKK